MDLTQHIRTVPNWPKQGIMFRDITSLLENPDAFAHCMNLFVSKLNGKKLDKIVGIDSRGFIFGAALAQRLHLPFVLVRKKGKLPGETISEEYALEYGTDSVEMHRNSISYGDKVVVVDDLIATGGTCLAACKLVEKLGGEIIHCGFVIDLPDLGGSKKIAEYNPFFLVEFEGE